jgi:hypothetical protein
MEIDQHPRPIRPACDDVIEIRVLRHEQIAFLTALMLSVSLNPKVPV